MPASLAAYDIRGLRIVRRTLLAHANASKFLSVITITFLLNISLPAHSIDIDDSVYRYIESRFGKAASQRIKQWHRLTKFDQNVSDAKKLDVVNNFFNKIEFVSDFEHWQKEDYWASPIEMLATNGGDCEDFSIAKYFTLRALGVPEEKMKVTYVKALNLNQAHMVLAYYETPDAEPLILDNLIAEIKKASERPDLAPVYSFNGEGLWLSKFGGKLGKRLGDSKNLNNWKQLLERHQKLVK